MILYIIPTLSSVSLAGKLAFQLCTFVLTFLNEDICASNGVTILFVKKFLRISFRVNSQQPRLFFCYFKERERVFGKHLFPCINLCYSWKAWNCTLYQTVSSIYVTGKHPPALAEKYHMSKFLFIMFFRYLLDMCLEKHLYDVFYICTLSRCIAIVNQRGIA